MYDEQMIPKPPPFAEHHPASTGNQCQLLIQLRDKTSRVVLDMESCVIAACVM